MNAPARLAVLGAGARGRGLAYVAALAGCPVALSDVDRAALADARRGVEGLVAEALKRGTLAEPDRAAVHTRLQLHASLAEATAAADVVVEAVSENLTIKQRLFAELERLVPTTALLATNTTTLPVGQIAAAMREPGRLIGLSFVHPVPVQGLAEVVTHGRSETSVVERAVAFARLLGTEPVVVRDAPVVAATRLGVALSLEAMRMLERGVGTAADLDRAMETSYHHPVGPLRLSDLVGLDERLAVAERLYEELRLDQYRPPQVLRDMVARGELGRKTGKGFYRWPESSAGT